MSMSLCLEFTQEWFREKYRWKPNECGVEFNNVPAYDAGYFFVSIDDGGVETGQQSTDSLKEVLSINIGIWRRKEHLMKDQLGQLKLPQDKYLVGSWTLSELERKVILPNLFGLHQNWQYMTALNQRYGLPDAKLGADFRYTFYYRGRSAMISQTLTNSNSPEQVWFGYQLRFSGLAREQVIHNSAYCLG